MPKTCITVTQLWYIAVSPMLRRASQLRHPRRLARIVCAVALVVMFAEASRIRARAASDVPIRGYWIARSALDSAATVRRAVTNAVTGAFDTVLVPVVLTPDEAPGF